MMANDRSMTPADKARHALKIGHNIVPLAVNTERALAALTTAYTEIDRLREALAPFAAIAEHVEYTDKRDGQVVHRQTKSGGGYAELSKADFRRAALTGAA